jgi:hypothetical protein
MVYFSPRNVEDQSWRTLRMSGLPQFGQIERVNATFALGILIGSLRRDQEVEVIFPVFLYELPLGVDHQSFKVCCLDHVEIFGSASAKSALGSEALVNRHGIQDGFCDIQVSEAVYLISIRAFSLKAKCPERTARLIRTKISIMRGGYL